MQLDAAIQDPRRTSYTVEENHACHLKLKILDPTVFPIPKPPRKKNPKFRSFAALSHQNSPSAQVAIINQNRKHGHLPQKATRPVGSCQRKAKRIVFDPHAGSGGAQMAISTAEPALGVRRSQEG
ncbi:unnamed protein product, partial [Musa acuminata var. zebrina]